MVVFALGATYAYMNITISNNNATGQGGCFKVSYTGTAINSDPPLQSTTNYLEGKQSQITLNKATDCQIYSEATIYIHTDPDATTAPIDTTQALKYKILQGETVISEGTITDKENDKALATVTLTETETVYDVYIWVDSTISSGAYNGTTYNGYFYAKSSQTSTLTE